jgi:hypothetical protein
MVMTINSSVCRGGWHRFCLSLKPDVAKSSGSTVTAVYLRSALSNRNSPGSLLLFDAFEWQKLGEAGRNRHIHSKEAIVIERGGMFDPTMTVCIVGPPANAARRCRPEVLCHAPSEVPLEIMILLIDLAIERGRS